MSESADKQPSRKSQRPSVKTHEPMPSPSPMNAELPPFSHTFAEPTPPIQVDTILQLQHVIGNQGLQRMLGRASAGDDDGSHSGVNPGATPDSTPAEKVKSAPTSEKRTPKITIRPSLSRLARDWTVEYEERVWEITFVEDEYVVTATLRGTSEEQPSEAEIVQIAQQVEAHYGLRPGTVVPDSVESTSIQFQFPFDPAQVESVEAAVTELEDYHSQRGWHRRLQQSPASELSVVPGQPARGSHPQVSPRVRYSPRTTQVTPISDDILALARAALIDRIEGRLRSVTIPTETGHLRLWGTQGDRNAGRFPGYAYSVRETTDEPFEAFWQTVREASTPAAASGVGIDVTDERTRKFWDAYRFIAGGEGDISAINTWDYQYLTIGSGFSARRGNAEQIYARMPAEFHENLYRYGIYVDTAEHQFVVLDTARGVVESGNDALQLIQVNERLLGVLIRAASSEEMMTQDEEEQPAQVWMLRAQFEQFQALHSRARSVFDWDSEANRRFAFVLAHWMPGALNWNVLQSPQRANNAQAIAEFAMQVLGSRADWARIATFASRAGVQVHRPAPREEGQETPAAND